MLRRITKDAGRFKAGVLHDWPLTVWHSVAKDAGFKTLEEFSTPEEMNTVLQMRKSGGTKVPVRGRANAQPAAR